VDLERPYHEAVVDREIARANLADGARMVRQALNNRGPRAEREAPSTEIFPDGLEGYTELAHASIAFEFRRLIDRIETHLAPEDPIRLEQVPVLRARIDEWIAADAAVDETLGDLEDAREAQSRAVAAWDRAIEVAYGVLVSRVGKAAAERCFPKGRRRNGASVAVRTPGGSGGLRGRTESEERHVPAPVARQLEPARTSGDGDPGDGVAAQRIGNLRPAVSVTTGNTPRS
jgi:hypothetical protein